MQDYRSYNDVLIRIRSAIDNKDGRSRHPVEAQINGSALGEASLSSNSPN